MLELEEFPITRDEKEILLKIEANYIAGESQITSGHPDTYRPGSPDDMEIIDIYKMIPLYGPHIKQRYLYEKWNGELTELEEENAIEELYETLAD